MIWSILLFIKNYSRFYSIVNCVDALKKEKE